MLIPRLWPLLGFQNGQGGGRETLSQAGTGQDTSSYLSPSADDPRSAVCFCLNTVHVGTCRHCCSLCPGRPNSQDAISPSAVSQALKYQSNLKKATEAKIRSSVSTGFNIQKQVRPPRPVGSGPHPSPWQPPLTSKMPSLRWVE